MTSFHILMCAVFSLLVATVLAQGPSTPVPPPQTWQDLVMQGNGVHSAEDFLKLLRKADGTNVTESDVFSDYTTADGKRVITGGGLFATADECSPRNMSVRLPLNYTDSQVAYYPECTMVQRCGGCCPTEFLTCEPAYKEMIVLKVLRARYLWPGAHSMRWEGFTSVTVERHLSCRAVCNVAEDSCGPLKTFMRYQCKCQCRMPQQCARPNQDWDEDTCSCRCRNPQPCCQNGQDDRTCVMYYDHSSCECTLKTSIGASPNASQAEIDTWLASRNAQQTAANGESNPLNSAASRDGARLPLPAAGVVSTTTTTTSTTSTTPTTPADPCANTNCPSRNFVRRLTDAGRCVCTLRIANRGRFSRRRG